MKSATRKGIGTLLPVVMLVVILIGIGWCLQNQFVPKENGHYESVNGNDTNGVTDGLVKIPAGSDTGWFNNRPVQLPDGFDSGWLNNIVALQFDEHYLPGYFTAPYRISTLDIDGVLSQGDRERLKERLNNNRNIAIRSISPTGHPRGPSGSRGRIWTSVYTSEHYKGYYNPRQERIIHTSNRSFFVAFIDIQSPNNECARLIEVRQYEEEQVRRFFQGKLLDPSDRYTAAEDYLSVVEMAFSADATSEIEQLMRIRSKNGLVMEDRWVGYLFNVNGLFGFYIHIPVVGETAEQRRRRIFSPFPYLLYYNPVDSWVGYYD